MSGGRPAIGPQHPVCCSRDEWAAVEALAAEYGINRSAQARKLIVLGLREVARLASTPERAQDPGA